MSRKMLKRICAIIIVLLIVFGNYVCIHTYANSRVLNQYAGGFKENVLGDYCKNVSNMVLSVYKAPLFKLKTNVAICDNKNNITLIVWIPLFGDEKKYGLIINDEQTETSYQILVDEQLIPYDKEDKEMIKGHQAHIADIKAVAKKMWNL